MKKLFLVILAGGIMMTACKKEDVKKESAMQTTPHSWKTSDWVMTKSSVIIEGTLCDEYINQKTGQVVYEGMEESKAIDYDRKAAAGISNGRLNCDSDGDNCHVCTMDGEEVLIIKKGTPIR